MLFGAVTGSGAVACGNGNIGQVTIGFGLFLRLRNGLRQTGAFVGRGNGIGQKYIAGIVRGAGLPGFFAGPALPVFRHGTTSWIAVFRLRGPTGPRSPAFSVCPIRKKLYTGKGKSWRIAVRPRPFATPMEIHGTCFPSAPIDQISREKISLYYKGIPLPVRILEISTIL